MPTHEPVSDATSLARMADGWIRIRPPDGVRVFLRPGGGFDLYLDPVRAAEWSAMNHVTRMRDLVWRSAPFTMTNGHGLNGEAIEPE
jgi:hypothetical protein